MVILILFAFLAGIVTILSPCILPLLPIILSGSLSGGKKRPLGIVTGFIISFTFFTLALSSIVKATGVNPDALRTIAVIVITLFGASLLIPKTQLWMELLMSKLSGLIPQSSQAKEGFVGGVLVGISLGLIWAPCVGPILASVITLAATSQITFATVLITLAYSLGTSIPMLVITYSGQQLLDKHRWLLTNSATIQKMFGVLMIATAVAIFFNIDRKFQTYLITKFPQYGAGLTALEDNSLVQNQLSKLGGEGTGLTSGLLLPQTQKAPDFVGGTKWLNADEPLSLNSNLKGKVVLVDFWTYSCINCVRTFPYLRKWYETYKDKDFVIVGVHSPEFEFEKDTENVSMALKDYDLQYPVVQDNDFAIWQAYSNKYWPAHYLIDKEGYIRYLHFGEGKYAETENAIRALLDEAPLSEADMPADPTFRKQTPEIYLGYGRAENYIPSKEIVINKPWQYPADKEKVPLDAVTLTGNWNVQEEYILAEDTTAALELRFLAESVHLVLSAADGEVQKGTVKVFLDGTPLPEKYYTSDSDKSGSITVTVPKKYDVVTTPNEYGEHLLRLEFSQGLSAYAFTFGS